MYSEIIVKRFIKIVFLFLIAWVLNIQGIPALNNPVVQSFDKLMYRADRQNWSVSSSQNGMIYFANTQGLLEFDGTTWHLNRLPNESIMRSVKVQNDSVIYTGGYRDLGYWKPDKYGKLHYYSLSEQAKKYLTNNIEFWNIVTSDSAIYFHSFSNPVLAFQDDVISVVDGPKSISVINKINGKILAAVRNEGIYQVRGKTLIPFFTDELFRDKLVQFIIPYKENQLLFGTASDGIFVWDGKSILPWNTQWTDYLVRNELNRGLNSGNGEIIVGTIIDGIVVFDEDGNLLMKINTQNGLSNNTVLGIETDEWQNIWLALDDGIGFIPHKQTKGFSLEKIPGIGAIYTLADYHDNLYLGTNRGLFVKPKTAVNKNYALVPETQGQTWDCKIIDDILFVGHNQGTFLVDGTDAIRISQTSGGSSIRQDPLNEDLLIQCTYNDLVVYKKTGNTYVRNNLISGFYDLIRYIEIDHLGNIWASHMYRGIYKITTDDERMSVKDTAYFGEKVFGKDHSINVFKVENRIVFTTENTIFTYDDLNDTIVPYTSLNQQLGKFSSSHRIIEAPDHHYWFITKSSIGLFTVNKDKANLVREYPTSLFQGPALVDRFENIIPITDTTAYLCLQNGLATLYASEKDSGYSMNQFEPILRQIELFSNRGKISQLPVNGASVKIKHNFNNIYFRFSFPQISDMPVSYKYYLDGLHLEWSESTINPALQFERLPQGSYNLNVKAVDLWGNESQVFTYSFEVLPPWYTSSFALSVYVVLLVLILLIFRTWGIRQTRRKEQQQHEKREQELIRLRNSKLRNEVEHKSKELASSTMSIIRKNEFLMELKEIVDKQKTDLGTRFPDKYYNYLVKKIDNNISNQDDWQIFENNFEHAHEQFFAKVRESFPELTPSDLRLCAYLRMNLSSKEIAPLLGISVRGVENHRYRLRKKMNLEHDESLVSTITGM